MLKYNEHQMNNDLIAIRECRYEDKPFIMSTWLKGLKFGNSWYKLIDDKIYFTVYHGVVERLLAKPGVSIKIACLKEDSDVILGYSVYENNKLHWVQVKQVWRKIGIAKELVPSNIEVVTHLTEVGKSIFLKKGWKFDPFLLL